MIILAVAGVLVSSLILIRATDILTDNLKSLARKTRLREFFLTSFIIGIGTTLPELFVGVTSALEGIPNISLGNAVGSNVANLSIIAGVAALISGGLNVRKKPYTTDFMYALFAGIAPILLLIDGQLTRVDGLILVSLFGYYHYALLNNQPDMPEDTNMLVSLVHRLKHNHVGKHIKRLFFALTLILLSADIIVRSGKFIAEGLGIPVFLIGLFLVAIGTSLPELAFGIRAIKRHEPEFFMGDLLGATVANTTLIVGITTLIHPIPAVALSEYVVAALVFVAIILMFTLFLQTRHRISRTEGIMLIGLYLLFIALEGYRHYWL